MKQRILCALSLMSALGVPVAAVADPVRLAQAMPAMLPVHEIHTIVRSAGFLPISPVVRRGETYVVRVSNREGREMRVVVDARRGNIMAAMPVIGAAPDVLPGERLGPYEPMPGYIPPPPPPIVRVEPGMLPPPAPMMRPPMVGTLPPIQEGGRPVIARPSEPIPGTQQRNARLPGVDMDDEDIRLTTPGPIMRDEGSGMLPPPPERFPQRALPPPQPAKPAAKPAPVKRAAAPPPGTPLPKPRPDAGQSAAADSQPGDKPAGEPAKSEPVKVWGETPKPAEPPKATAEAPKPAAEAAKPAEAATPAQAAKPAAAPATPPAATAPEPSGKVDPRSLPH